MNSPYVLIDRLTVQLTTLQSSNLFSPDDVASALHASEAALGNLAMLRKALKDLQPKHVSK